MPAGMPALHVITQHALAGRVEASQPLDVDVHQLTRPGPLIATRQLDRATRKPRAAIATKHLPHHRGRPAKQPSHDHRPRIRIATSSQNLQLRLPRQTPRLAMWHRRAITHTLPASIPIPPPPPIRRRATRTRRARRHRRRHPRLNRPHRRNRDSTDDRSVAAADYRASFRTSVGALGVSPPKAPWRPGHRQPSRRSIGSTASPRAVTIDGMLMFRSPWSRAGRQTATVSGARHLAPCMGGECLATSSPGRLEEPARAHLHRTSGRRRVKSPAMAALARAEHGADHRHGVPGDVRDLLVRLAWR